MSTLIETQERFRFRCKSLCIEEKVAAVRASLANTKGVVEVTVNKRVGSLLVLFDKAKVNAETLFLKVAEDLGIDRQKFRDEFSRKFSRRAGRRGVKQGMLGAGLLSLALLAYSGKAHALVGGVGITLLAAHLYQNKRTLFS